MADRRGKFLGMPYDWRRPTKKRLKSNAWDEDGKVFTPKTVGWGYGVNFEPSGIASPGAESRSDGPCWA
jgi:hypothetical protein